MCGVYYFLNIVYDYSRVVWVCLLTDKINFEKTNVDFFYFILRQFGKHVKIVQSDNGSEFMCMKGYFRKTCVIYQNSCVGTPHKMEELNESICIS